MNHRKKAIQRVLWKYKQKQTLTKREETLMYKWVAGSDLHLQLFDELSNDDYWNNETAALKTIDGDPAWTIIGRRLDDIAYFENRTIPVWKKYLVAASVIILITFSAIIYNSYVAKNNEQKNINYTSALNKNE